MKEQVFKCGQSGFAVGCIFVKNQAFHRGNAAGRDFDTAVQLLRKSLGSSASDSIFEAELTLLDNDMIPRILDRMKLHLCSATEAVRETGAELREQLEQSENAYIRSRAEDIRGLTDSLLRLLAGEECELPGGSFILAAEELSPAELASYPPEQLMGLITARGAATSHVSILCGNRGIPYLYGNAEAVAALRGGERAILRGDTLILEPDEAQWAQALEEQSHSTKKREPSALRTSVRIYANVAGVSDAKALAESDAEGVGLFRSEFLYLDSDHEPGEQEQYQAYKTIAELMGERECVIRTMDIGSDKQSDWLPLPEEKNPALGCRGLRLSLQKAELFRVQLRALLRAAADTNIQIMVPMVASLWEIDAVREQLRLAAAELEEEGIPCRIPALGAMIETPAAVMIASELAEKVAFFSIGTNDLTQYTLALDREAEGLEDYYDPCHEAVMRLIALTVKAAHSKQIPVAVCGELAANPKAIGRLLELGVDELSVSIAKISATRALAAEYEQGLTAKKKSSPPASLLSPADGELFPMEEIPDAAFAGGLLGPCIGILPTEGKLYAPANGTITNIAPTRHAITLLCEDGRMILLHVGIDSVSLKGEGFSPKVSVGEKVSADQLLMEFDLNTLRKAKLSPMVIMVLCD